MRSTREERAGRQASRRIVLSAVMVAGSVGGAGIGAAETQADAVATVQALVEAYRESWNTHEASQLAAFFAEDADFVMGPLPAVRGRDGIRDWWHGYFSRQEPGRRLALQVSSIRVITDDVAVVGVATTTEGRDEQGRALPVRRFRGRWLMRRQNADWLIAGMFGLPIENDRIELNASLEAAETLRPRIRAFVDAYEDALNAHDPIALSGFYGDDAEIVVRDSPSIQGRPAIEAWWRSYFSEPRPYRAILILDEIRTVAANVAFLSIVATGALPPSEGPRPPVRYARAKWVVVRDAGEWRIASLWVLPSEDDRLIRESERPDGPER